MPKKAGAPWTEDELTLALDVYLSNPFGQLSQHHPAVIELSTTLKQAPINLDWTRDDSYRPPDGVRSRIGNFNRLNLGDDTNVPSSALKVWHKFQNRPDKLKKKSNEILSAWERKKLIRPIGRLPFVKGETYKRSHLHDLWGGSRQSGISPSAKQRIVFIFTGSSGAQYGYVDHWEGGIFKYVGEGQLGDMQMTSGNAAVLNHVTDGKDLLLFEEADKRSYVKFVGQMACSGYEQRIGHDKDGNDREIIVFELIPAALKEETEEMADVAIDESEALEKLRILATETAMTSPSSKERKVNYYTRSKAIKLYALERSKGICEKCSNEAPFMNLNGKPFLEVHHIERLSDGGPDAPDSVAALCPNCHREAHYSAESEVFNISLKKLIKCKEAKIKTEGLL